MSSRASPISRRRARGSFARHRNLIDLSALDTRQYRSDQVCAQAAATNCAAAAAATDPARTILGAEQEKWLFDQLATARAKWTVLGQQVPSFAFAGNMDKWDGYVAARQRLYARLRETKAANPILLSRDVHNHFAADLKIDFANLRSETVGVEFTNTSVTSGGDGADVAPTWERIRSDNPHIKYHSARRGHIACTATQTTMRADFKILDKVTVPELPARIGGSIVVEDGRAGGMAG